MEGDEEKSELMGGGGPAGGPPRRLPGSMRPPMRPGGGGDSAIKDLFMLHMAHTLGPDSEEIAKALIERRPLVPGQIQHLVDELGRMELTPPQQQALDGLRAKLEAGSGA